MTLRLSAILVVITFAACSHAVRTGRLIDRYRSADCIPLVTSRGGQALSGRSWDHTIKIQDDLVVHISGAQVPGGQIDVRYPPSEEWRVAADAGDYIYPADVRFDGAGKRLYVKADGRPVAFGGRQVWLFEYDLQQKRRTGRMRIALDVLPPECGSTP